MRTIDVRLTYDENKTKYVMDEFYIQDAVTIDGITVKELPDNEYKIKRLKKLCGEMGKLLEAGIVLDANKYLDLEQRLRDEGVVK